MTQSTSVNCIIQQLRFSVLIRGKAIWKNAELNEGNRNLWVNANASSSVWSGCSLIGQKYLSSYLKCRSVVTLINLYCCPKNKTITTNKNKPIRFGYSDTHFKLMFLWDLLKINTYKKALTLIPIPDLNMVKIYSNQPTIRTFLEGDCTANKCFYCERTEG